MAWFRKVVGGLVKAEIDEFIGEEGNLFFDVETGALRLSDGLTPGGISVGGGGGGTPLSVGLINSSNVSSGIVQNITNLRFDIDSGFDVTNLGSGTVKIGMNSTFKTWKVAGQSDLVATGLDTIEFEAGAGVTITTNPTASPHKRISISSASQGNIDGGGADTNYGGLEVIDAGGI